MVAPSVPRYSDFDKTVGRTSAVLQMDCGGAHDGANVLKPIVRLAYYLCQRGAFTSGKRCVPLCEEFVFFIAGDGEIKYQRIPLRLVSITNLNCLRQNSHPPA